MKPVATSLRTLLPRTLTICALLFAGMIINVGLAWLFACTATTRSTILIEEHHWPLQTPNDWPAMADYGWLSRGFGISVLESRARSLTVDSEGFRPVFGTIHFGVGWPLRSMQWSSHNVTTQSNAGFTSWPTYGAWRSGLEPYGVRKDRWANHRRMPIAPLWAGLALDSLFFAACLWLLTLGALALRRKVRIHRQRCPQCAYPIGTSEFCTECGEPLQCLKRA